jgi:hypothetical protein
MEMTQPKSFLWFLLAAALAVAVGLLLGRM